MASNPFLDWPLWHYFTTHMQNIDQYNDQIRRHTVSDIYISVTQDSVLSAVIDNLVVYDFMSDRLVRGREIRNLHIVPITAVLSEQVNTIPSNLTVIVKGRPRDTPDGRVSGGEFIPLVGSAIDLNLAIQGMNAYASDTPSNALDILKNKKDLAVMKQGPKYNNALIRAILSSYTKTTTVAADETKLITKITRKLSKPLGEGKAINVTKGSPVNASSTKYTIQELSVVIPGESVRRVVKFAFPNSLRADEREVYNNILRTTFQSEPVRSTAISTEERRTIEIRPVRLSTREYTQLFEANESFNNYINNISRVTQGQTIDVSQILHNIPREEDEDLDEDEFEDEDLNEL